MNQQTGLEKYAIEILDSVCRVSRRQYPPMESAPWAKQGLGRFDDPTIGVGQESEGYTVLYCAENPKAAFVELLQQLRPRMDQVQKLLAPLMLDAGEREEADSVVGIVTNKWMDNVALTRARFILAAPVFDLANPEAIQAIRSRFAIHLLAMGLDEFDFSHILSNDRDLTRAISRWLWTLKNDSGSPMFSGIRYRSRLDPESICIALYQDRYAVDGDIDVQPVTSSSPGLAEAASILRLNIS